MRSTATGFTLIELLVTLTIAGMLMALGLPAMTGYLNTAKVGSAAQSFHSGLQLARTEAIRRNVPVQFLLTNSAVASGVAATATPDVAGRAWLVRAQDASGWELIDGRAGGEGNAASVTVAPSASAVMFNGFGGTATGAGFSLALSFESAGCGASATVRCKTVRVSPGGQVSTCDPQVSDTTDSRFCTP